MNKSPNLGLSLTSASDVTKKFKDFRTELSGEHPESNMMILDKEVSNVKNRITDVETQNDELYSNPVTWRMLKYGFGNRSANDYIIETDYTWEEM